MGNIYAQEKDSFHLFLGGKKYKKTNVYLLYQTNEEDKKIIDKDNIEFYIGIERFFHDKKKHSIDTLSHADFVKLKITDIKDLKNLEYAIYKKILQEEKLNIPQPPNHNILNVYILEAATKCRFIKYEVNWVFSAY